MKHIPFRLAAYLALAGAGTAWATGTGPAAISPGSRADSLTIEDRCPTFNWSAVDGAQAYELEVLRVGRAGETAPETVEPT